MRPEPATPLPFPHVERAGDVVAYPSGQLDLADVDMLRAALDQMIAAGKEVVLHMDHVEFLDVAAANVLLAARNQARARGHNLLIVNPRPVVRRLLILLGMDALLRNSPA